MKYTAFEEILHSISHFIGFVLAIVGTFFLLSSVSGFEKTIAAIVYSITLILTFGSSSIYHYLTDLKLKEQFLIADHISIYLLIAGTYTPLVLFGVHEYIWIILTSIWVVTIFSIYFRSYFGDQLFIQYTLYLLLGYNFIFYPAQLSYLALNSLSWIIAGGTLYTIGLFFYKFKIIKYNHFIWHILVLFATICHYFGIYGLLA